MTEPLIEAVDVERTYRGPTDVAAVRGVSLCASPGRPRRAAGPERLRQVDVPRDARRSRRARRGRGAVAGQGVRIDVDRGASRRAPTRDRDRVPGLRSAAVAVRGRERGVAAPGARRGPGEPGDGDRDARAAGPARPTRAPDVRALRRSAAADRGRTGVGRAADRGARRRADLRSRRGRTASGSSRPCGRSRRAAAPWSSRRTTRRRSSTRRARCSSATGASRPREIPPSSARA